MADKIKITSLTTGTPKATDYYPGVDTTDHSQSSSGTTKKYLNSTLRNYFVNAFWSEITGLTQTMSVNKGYISNNAARVVFTLPTTSAVGDELRIVGKGAGGWGILLNSGQTIRVGSSVTTTSTGSIASSEAHDAIQLVCTTANTAWIASSGPQSAAINFDTL
jgi:hypothetical protein